MIMNARLAVKSFIINNNKLLVVKRRLNDVQKPGIWEIPGGRLNIGEDPFEGLKRETKEETNLDIEIIKPLNVRHFTRDDKQVITLIIFLCKPSSKNIKLSEEHTAYDWIDLDNKKLAEFYRKEVELFKRFEMHRYI